MHEKGTFLRLYPLELRWSVDEQVHADTGFQNGREVVPEPFYGDTIRGGDNDDIDVAFGRSGPEGMRAKKPG